MRGDGNGPHPRPGRGGRRHRHRRRLDRHAQRRVRPLLRRGDPIHRARRARDAMLAAVGNITVPRGVARWGLLRLRRPPAAAPAPCRPVRGGTAAAPPPLVGGPRAGPDRRLTVRTGRARGQAAPGPEKLGHQAEDENHAHQPHTAHHHPEVVLPSQCSRGLSEPAASGDLWSGRPGRLHSGRSMRWRAACHSFRSRTLLE